MEPQKKEQPFIETYALLVLIGFVAIGALLLQISSSEGQPVEFGNADYDAIAEQVIPQSGVELPVVWGDLGKRLSETGAIDSDAWRAFYGNEMSPEWEQLFSGD